MEASMHHFEDGEPADEFEIEFADLPEDENRAVAGKLITQGVLLVAKFQGLSRTLASQGLHLLARTSNWLMAEAPGKQIVQADKDSEFELEIADLPSDEQTLQLGLLIAWREGLTRKVRLRRLILLSCTLLLLFSLILGEFPAARDWTYKLFVHTITTPIPAIFSSVGSYCAG
jgi:hypothetical protein